MAGGVWWGWKRRVAAGLLIRGLWVESHWPTRLEAAMAAERVDRDHAVE